MKLLGGALLLIVVVSLMSILGLWFTRVYGVSLLIVEVSILAVRSCLSQAHLFYCMVNIGG